MTQNVKNRRLAATTALGVLTVAGLGVGVRVTLGVERLGVPMGPAGSALPMVEAAGVRGGTGGAFAAPQGPKIEEVAEPPTPAKSEGQAIGAMELPELAPAVSRLLDASYLTEDERADLRIKHGVWEAEDLRDVKRRARAALIAGAYGDASLRDPAVPAADRAEALIELGKLEEALQILSGVESVRASRLRATAMLLRGDARGAATALGPVAEAMSARKLADADEVVEAVRGMLMLARIKGPAAEGGSAFETYQQLTMLLGQARETMDKLSWQVALAECELLRDKDNLPEAGEALEAALSLNPRSGRAWRLLGDVAAAGFDFKRAEAVAARIDVLASDRLGLEDADSGKGSWRPPVSLHGAIVRARMHLRENEGAKAAGALAGALEAAPESREARALQAAASGVAWDFAGAEEKLASFEAISPGSALAYAELGRALADSRQYEEASRFLNEAVKREPNWSMPAIELGLLEMQSGRDQEALAALEHAAALDPINVRVANSLKLVRELVRYGSAESENFIVRFRPGEDEVLAREMLPVLEKIHARVTGDGAGGIDHKPSRKTVIELLPDHHWFAVRITGMNRIHTIAAATGPVVAMEAPREGPGHLTGPYDWPRVVQHEFTHTVTLSRTRNRLPHWFTEAAAVYLEDRPRDWNVVQLLANAYRNDQLFDLEAVNVGFVRPARPMDRQLAYAQSHWMYQFIVERFGARKPLELMDLYAVGEREEGAFTRVLGVGREEFLKQFKVWAKDQLISWGMVLADGVPTVEELAKGSPAGDPGAGDKPVEPTLAQIEGWLTEHPTHPDLLRRAVKLTLEANGDSPDASMIPLLEQYASACPPDSLPRKLLARLYGAAMSGDGGGGSDESAREKFIAHLEWLDVREQSSAGYAMELARQYAGLGRWDDAARKADRAAQIAPYDGQVREFAATIALRHNDLKTAERHIHALTILEPNRAVHKQRLEAVRKKISG